MVGATLGGGVGPYGGLHGLQIDSLKSVRMVTGVGNLITVSATQNPDLFWGMRGAGFNFGVVTSATYQIYPYTNNGQAMNADFRFNASANASLYEFARSYTGKQPDAFSIDIAIAYNEDFGGVGLLQAFLRPIIPQILSQLTEDIIRLTSSPTSSTQAPSPRVSPSSNRSWPSSHSNKISP